jgi:hypothetical protein
MGVMEGIELLGMAFWRSQKKVEIVCALWGGYRQD